ncbi:phosphatidylglycerophosphatase A [Candidatus Sumerlaeota bacterium]|nr:phosphatidylglycerophosphatase A [Candidatus Sumerlaeota bacterium]
MKKTIMLIATGLGTGYLPISGTMASILAIVLFLPLSYFNTSENGLFLFYLSFTFFLTGLSIWSATIAEKWLKEKDPHKVVIDEIAGYFYAMLLLPAKPWILASSFLLFRLFDIWKPFPIRQSQKLPGGVGITIDDILAGIYACAILHIIRGLFPP